MTQRVAPDQKDNFVTIRMIVDADGKPAESVVASTGGHVIWYRRDGAAVVTDATAAADLAALTTSHTDWEFLHIRDGYYTVALPDAAFIKGVGKTLCGMDATGISCVAESVIIDQFLKFQGKAESVTATTTTFPAGTTPQQGDEIYVIAGTGDRQTRLVLSVAGEVATHLAWDSGRNISASTSTIVLLPGDETLADGGINVDTTVSSRSDVTTAQVNTEAALALDSYDSPTRTEATADKDSLATDIAALNDIADSDVLTQVNAALDTAIAELGVAAPTATPTLRTGLMLIYMAILNQRDTIAAADEIHNAAGTVIATASVSDDGVLFRKTKYT